MKNNQELIVITKQITEKSDRLSVWNSKRFNFETWKSEKRDCQFWSSVLYQLETKLYNPQTERLWIYVNQPENKLKYIFEFKKTPFRPGELPADPNCNNEDCCEESRKFNQRKTIFNYAYELTLIHEFTKGNTLSELQKYKHKESGKYFFVPKPTRSFVYGYSYPELVKDIITGKIY